MNIKSKKYYIKQLKLKGYKAYYANVYLDSFWNRGTNLRVNFVCLYIAKSKIWIYFPIDFNGEINQFTEMDIILKMLVDQRYFDSWIYHYDVMN